MTNDGPLLCRSCGSPKARRYQLFIPGAGFETQVEHESVLCVGCARRERKNLVDGATSETPAGSLTRRELIDELDSFFEASGARRICRRCHEQGTGCCPPSCRVMGAGGCDPQNSYGKTLFCTTFLCSALLNAIHECDPEIGRTLKRVKSELGPAEFHIYEMITRVPAPFRESIRPLALPKRYPRPPGLKRGRQVSGKLSALTDEVLEIRRRWSECEKHESSVAVEAESLT